MHRTLQESRFLFAVAGGGLMSLGLFLLMQQLIAGHPVSGDEAAPPPGIDIVRVQRPQTVVRPPATPPPPHAARRPPSGVPLTPVNQTPVPPTLNLPDNGHVTSLWPAPNPGARRTGHASLQVRFRTPPLYPPAAAYQSVEGSVTACFTVTAAGSVINPYVAAASSPRAGRLLGAAALSAVMQWKFFPRLVNGQTVATPSVCQVIHFRLDRP